MFILAEKIEREREIERFKLKMAVWRVFHWTVIFRKPPPPPPHSPGKTALKVFGKHFHLATSWHLPSTHRMQIAIARPENPKKGAAAEKWAGRATQREQLKQTSN